MTKQSLSYRKSKFGFLLVCVFFGSVLWVCWFKKQANEFVVSLYTGIPGLAKLDDSYLTITKNTQFPFVPVDFTSSESALEIGIVYGIHFPTLGATIYFKRAGSCLIVLEPPFKGTIRSSDISLFTKGSEKKDWSKTIISELGDPQSTDVTGFGNHHLYFYPWGDIEFNKDGIKRLMLYRDKQMTLFRFLIPDRNFNVFN